MWKLDVWNANKSTLLNTITNTTPGGLSGGFRWQLKPDGDTVQLEFSGRNDRLKLPPRGVVALTVDGQPAFYGIVPDPPSAASPNIEQAQVLGGREALRVTLLDGAVYRQQGVYQIVRDILSRLCPPALAYDPALIGDGSGTDAGPGLDLYYSPTMPLTDALDGLAKSAGTTWGVDAQGRVFFGRPSPAALNVAYAGQPWRRLPVQGREAVTQAVLRVVSAPGQGALSAVTVIDEFQGVPYLPATIGAVATHPQHGTYNAQRSLEAPQGVSLTRDSYAGTASYNGFDGPGATDGDPATSSTATGTTPGIAIENTTERVIGLRLRYTYAPTEGLIGVVAIQHTTLHPAGGSAYTSSVAFGLPESGSPRDMAFIAPPSAEVVSNGWDVSQVQVYVITPDGAGTAPVALTIYDMAQIVVDEVTATRTAESYLQVPYASPAELTLPGLIPPSPTVSVTGSPDGDVTGNASLFEYEHTPERPRTTRVKIGADGQSAGARAIRWAVRAGG